MSTHSTIWKPYETSTGTPFDLTSQHHPGITSDTARPTIKSTYISGTPTRFPMQTGRSQLSLE